MSDPIFGINIQRIDEGALPAIVSDMSIVGIIGTAPAANTETFPLDTPVFMYSDDTAKLTALGATGTLLDGLTAINNQLGDFQVAAKVVLVRVTDDADPWEVIDNILGSQASRTGMWALINAGPVLGQIPRLICVPGYTSQQYSGLASLTLGTQGADMTEAPVVGFTGGGSDPDKVLPTAHAVLGTGADAGKVVQLVIDTPGKNLSGTITVTFTGGGSGTPTLPTATGTIEVLANPICAALPALLNRLIAHAVVDGPATSLQDYTNWRETISSDRIIPIETAVKVGTGAGVVKPASPRVVGIGVRRDHEFGGLPFHSWANQNVAGIIGPNRPIEFSLTDGATEGQTILEQNGGIIIRGEMGVESAIASSGFVYIGTDTCSDNPLWQFYNVTRGRDFIHLALLRTLRTYLGKRNIDAGTIQDILDTMSFLLRDLEADNCILPGWRVFFTRDQNSPEQMRLGRFTVDFACEEPPVLRYLGIRSQRNRASLNILLDQLMAQVDVAVAA